jgi:para-nitrobenzyl esterase
LNIFVPVSAIQNSKIGNPANLPVVIYFHFGTFQRWNNLALPGNTFETYNKAGVIFISANYRLGIFGHFAHPALSAEDPLHKSNFGLYDQRAVLKWVQRNIRSFGGDPSKVTLSGMVFLSCCSIFFTFCIFSPPVPSQCCGT